MSRPNGCNGSCCTNFPIGSFDTSKDLFIMLDANYDIWIEAQKLKDMLIVLQENPPRYTCIHFNTETRLCMDYENRPDMCRNYPSYDYHAFCVHCWMTTEQLTGRILT